MKAFKQYLVESKRTFDFRIRIADHELPNETLDKIERGLMAFDLADITKPKNQPVAYTREFHTLGPVGRKQFEVKLNYPTSPETIKTNIHNNTGIPACCIVVRGAMEDDILGSELHAHPEQSLNAGVDNYQEDNQAQAHVGMKRVDSLLKELQAAREQNKPQQVKNVNDDILAADVPKEKAPKTILDLPQNNTSPVSANKTPRGK
jgi:hypothetical protein